MHLLGGVFILLYMYKCVYAYIHTYIRVCVVAGNELRSSRYKACALQLSQIFIPLLLSLEHLTIFIPHLLY